MVRFDNLRISEDKSSLLVQCSVRDYDVYSNMYISKIYLEYYENRLALGSPSSKAKLIFDNTNDDHTIRSVSRTVTLAELSVWSKDMGVCDFDGEMFYVIVICDGVPSPELMHWSCGADNTVDIGVVLDWQKVYKSGMGFFEKYFSMNTGCQMDPIEHYVLQWYGMKLAISTCDWDLLDRLWAKFVGSSYNMSASGGCSCGK